MKQAILQYKVYNIIMIRNVYENKRWFTRTANFGSSNVLVEGSIKHIIIRIKAPKDRTSVQHNFCNENWSGVNCWGRGGALLSILDGLIHGHSVELWSKLLNSARCFNGTYHIGGTLEEAGSDGTGRPWRLAIGGKRKPTRDSRQSKWDRSSSLCL